MQFANDLKHIVVLIAAIIFLLITMFIDSFLICQVIVDQKVCFYCDGYGVRPKRCKRKDGLANDFSGGNSNYGNGGNAGSPYLGGTGNAD